MVNTLYYGDNLDILRSRIAGESIDLIYLDPPFNSKATYNLLFRSPTGQAAQAQRDTFKDTWHWDTEAAKAFQQVLASGTPAARMLDAMHSFIGQSDVMAYLSMMAIRLIELHRVLKPSGVLYLHCDPTASHYLKLILDAIFGAENFLNDIVWKRTTTKSDFRQGAVNWPRIHDDIFYYAKNARQISSFEQLFAPYGDDYVDAKYGKRDDDGRRYMLDNLTAPGAGSRGHPKYELLGVTRYWRYGKEKMLKLVKEGRVVQPRPGAVPRYKRYLDEVKGIAIGDFWGDINNINSMARERLGFQTQKPLALLERIISTSSKPGDVMLDPFCGCGTAIHAAHRLGRMWIGIDVAYEAVMIIEARLQAASPQVKRGPDYKLEGIPKDESAARALARDNPYAFQAWAVSLLRGGQPHGAHEAKKGKDKGIDGLVFFQTGRASTGYAVVSVKGTDKVGVQMIRDLRGTMEREAAAIGIFVSLSNGTRDMRSEAADAGAIDIGGKLFPKLQIYSVKDLMGGGKAELPPVYELANLLNLPKGVASIKVTPPGQLRKQINMLLPLKGGKDRSKPGLFDEEAPRQPRSRASARGR